MSDYCSMHGRFEMTTGTTCPQCVGQLFGAAPAPDTEPPSLSDAKRDRMWCLALIPEGSEVIQRVTSRFLALRSTGDAAPTEPSEAAVAAAAEKMWIEPGRHDLAATADGLRAAYAVDGVRAAPTEPAIAEIITRECGTYTDEERRAVARAAAAIAELRATPDAARLIAEAEKILAHRAVASPFRESLREAVEQARLAAPDAARLQEAMGAVVAAHDRLAKSPGDGLCSTEEDEAQVCGCNLCEQYRAALAGGSSSQEGDG